MIKRFLVVLTFVLALSTPVLAQFVTLTGTLASSNGMPAQNYLMTFQLSQFGYISGTGVVVNTATSCATSTDGSVVGLHNPLVKPPVSVGFTGTLPPANYYVKFGFYDAAGNVTLVSPETVIQLNSTGRLIVAPPVAGMPAGASGMRVYISATTNTETLQGSSTGAAAYLQTIPLVTGAAVPASNTTICKQIANDAIWPTGTGYTVALADPSGNTIPGYPMQWQLMGPNTTINLSTGLPYYHGTVYFPTPILASPLNHALQTISGPLGLSGYNLTNVGAIGVGTTLPAWSIDVENGPVNASGGFIYNGGAGVSTGDCLVAGSDAFHIFAPSAAPCITTATTFYYQTFKFNGTPATQQIAANFSQRFAKLTDTTGQTNVDLNAPGTGNLVATYASDPGSSTFCATFDGNKNLVPATGNCVTSAAITGTLTQFGSSPIGGDSCTSYTVTMSASVPSGSTVVISPDQGNAVSSSGGISPFIQGISGSTVTVNFCNNWDTGQGWNAATYNLKVIQ